MTKRLGGRITRISVVLPAVFATLICLIGFLVGAGWLQARYQANSLSEIATRDIKVRSAASALANAANDINTRLVSVLGGVHSASGSVLEIERLFANLRSNWSALNELLSGAEADELAGLTERYRDLDALGPKILEALRGNYVEQVAQVYDGWLDHAGPFRTDLQALVSGLDDRGSQKIVAILAGANRGAELSLLLAVVGGLVGLIAGGYVLLGVTRPLAGIERVIAGLSRGNYHIAIKETRRHDEVGKIIGALFSFQSSLAENETLRADQARQAQRAERERRELLAKFTGELQTSICAVAESVSAAAVKIENSITATRDLVGRTEDQAHIAAEAAAKASHEVQSVAGASKQLMASISEIGSRVAQSTDIVNRAAAQATQVNSTMSSLSKAMRHIEQIVDLIRDVSAQTNLLALNATIEAARAGEAGRGFSVVAGEVKQLAGQTSKATDEIALQIAQIQRAGQSVMEAIGGITSTIDQMSEIADEIAGAVQEQESATVEICRSVDEVAAGAGKIAGSITKASDAATETDKQAAELKTAATELNLHATTLRREIERFVAATRAA